MRLIDADTLIADCQLAQKQADRHGREFANAFYSGGGEVSTEWWCVEDMIENAPTIEPEPHWIPCSERLPKEEDYRECMECLDGAVWYYTNRKTMGLGYYYDSTKQWSTICDMKPDGKVIAWKPLPEPYKEGD